MPRSAKEWKALPELSMKHIANPAEAGTVYTVLKAGFCPVRFAELAAIGIDGEKGDGMFPLPTVTVETDEGAMMLYRLPAQLNGWAYHAVAMAASRRGLFPCAVEFGFLRGRPYAEFVVPPPQKLN